MGNRIREGAKKRVKWQLSRGVRPLTGQPFFLKATTFGSASSWMELIFSTPTHTNKLNHKPYNSSFLVSEACYWVCVAWCIFAAPLFCCKVFPLFAPIRFPTTIPKDKNAPPSNFSRFTSEEGEKSKLGKEWKLKRRQLDKLVKVLAKLDWQMMVVWASELFFSSKSTFSSNFKVWKVRPIVPVWKWLESQIEYQFERSGLVYPILHRSWNSILKLSLIQKRPDWAPASYSYGGSHCCVSPLELYTICIILPSL